MYTISFIILFIILVIAFRKVNILPVTEIISMWLFIILLSGLLINAIITNLELVAKPMAPDTFTAYFFIQRFITPLVMLFIINFYQQTKLPLKFGVIAAGTIALMIAELFVEYIGIIQYLDWDVWNSLFLWLTITLGSIGFYYFITSSFIKRDGQHV